MNTIIKFSKETQYSRKFEEVEILRRFNEIGEQRTT